jgi:hypothetical protein
MYVYVCVYIYIYIYIYINASPLIDQLVQPHSASKCWSQHKVSPLNAILNEAEEITN